MRLPAASPWTHSELHQIGEACSWMHMRAHLMQEAQTRLVPPHVDRWPTWWIQADSRGLAWVSRWHSGSGTAVCLLCLSIRRSIGSMAL